MAYAENQAIVEALWPETADDWLIVAGDVGEVFADIERTLCLLRGRFGTLIWVPGNHELWTHPSDPVRLRGVERYEALVSMCQDNGILTPEDCYPVWHGSDGAVTVVPLFQLYDYSFRPAGASSKVESLGRAYDAGVVCTDEMLLHPDPYEDRESWCWARLRQTQQRLDAIDQEMSTVLVSHWPLVRQPTDVLRFPEFSQWCGTEQTADWHVRYRAVAAVYGHLHIPRTTMYDGVRFEEVSLGYPREWKRRRGGAPRPMRRILGGTP